MKGQGFDEFDRPPERAPGRPRFQVDAVSRLGEAGPEVLLAFQVPYRALFFRPVGSRFLSEFELIMTLYRGDQQIGGEFWSERNEVATFEETRTATMIRRTLPIASAAGRFEAEVIARESGAGRENRAVWKIDVPDYAHLPLSLSSLWITECPSPLPDSIDMPPSEWVLNRRFGEPLAPLCLVGEAYRPGLEPSQENTGIAGADGAVPSPARLVWRILGTRGDEAQRGELLLDPLPRVPFRIRPDFSALWLGEYTLEVAVSVGEEHARRRMSFVMDETLSSLENDLTQSLELIALVARDDEVRELKEAAPPVRKEVWNRFWKRHDPTPETLENEFKDEFFARVRYANEQFSVLGVGWRSDRGRIYIQNGPPDSIESFPYNLDGPPYEIWIYNRLGRRFVFVDYDGYGRYELARPGRS